ncbi:MAG: Hsp20/alpha crystallin family protein [Chloroflexi bacterium]|nr:Hsp20/alpha crystallin family protein [Chloroflexota bacterium]MDA8188649.1 Hsp20/alpha crystallin family protein [Dehalococcoidales bacterium]
MVTKKGEKKEEAKPEKEIEISSIVGGTLDLFGLKIDLAKLISSPEDVEAQLEGLRERLKRVGGKEILTDEEWKRKGATVSGYVRTHGILGEHEYHVGTSAAGRPEVKGERVARPEIIEPPVDVIDEPQQMTIVAEVPGVGLDDLDIKIEAKELSIATKPGARRAYKKVVQVAPGVDPATMRSTCRNGVLEIRIKKKAEGGHRTSVGMK